MTPRTPMLPADLSMDQLATVCQVAVHQAMSASFECVDHKFLSDNYMRWYEIALLIINMQDRMLGRISQLQSNERMQSRLELSDLRNEVTQKVAKVLKPTDEMTLEEVECKIIIDLAQEKASMELQNETFR